MNNKFVFFILILIFGLVCVGGVSANDQVALNTTNDNADSELNLDVNTALNSQFDSSKSVVDGSHLLVEPQSGEILSNESIVVDDNTTINDNSVSDGAVSNSNGTVGNQTKSLTDLKNLISKGPGNYTLNEDYKFNSSLDGDFKGIVINGDYVINGNDHVIDGASSTSLFNIAGGHVALLNMTCMNFKGDGAVVYAKDCDLNMSNCFLMNNNNMSASNFGAVYLDHVKANICENSFINNKAKEGAAIYIRGGNLALINNMFSSNNATGKGGAVYVNGTKIVSSMNVFKDNTACDGGAVYFDDKCDNSSVMNDMFMNNTAFNNGGAIYSSDSSNIFVVYSNFMNNSAKNGKSINAEKGSVYCKLNTFDNEKSFVPSWNNARGKCVFISVGLQTVNSGSSNVPMVDFVEAMSVNPEKMNYKTNTTTYFSIHYHFSNFPNTIVGTLGQLSSSLSQLSSLQNKNDTNPFTTASIYGNMVNIDRKVMDYIKVMKNVKPSSFKTSSSNPFMTIESSVVMEVHNNDDLENAKYLAAHPSAYSPFLQSVVKIDKLVLNLEKNHVFTFNTQEEGSVFNVNVENIFLVGDNTTFKVANTNNRHEFHFITMGQDKKVLLFSLTVSGFNTAVLNNGGLLYLKNTTLSHNTLNYRSDQDYGGAIKNFGIVIADNSSFIDNYAKKGGAIYNRGYVELTNCSFSGNTGYGEGNDIYNFKTGKSNLTNTTCSVVYKEGLSTWEKFGITLGATVISIIGVTVLCAIPGVTLVAGGIIGAVLTGALMGGASFLKGYWDENINWKEIGVEIAIGVVTGAITGVLAAKAAQTYRAINEMKKIECISGSAEQINNKLAEYGLPKVDIDIFQESTPGTRILFKDYLIESLGIKYQVILGSDFLSSFQRIAVLKCAGWALGDVVASNVGLDVYDYYNIPKPVSIPQNLTIPKS